MSKNLRKKRSLLEQEDRLQVEEAGGEFQCLAVLELLAGRG